MFTTKNNDHAFRIPNNYIIKYIRRIMKIYSILHPPPLIFKNQLATFEIPVKDTLGNHNCKRLNSIRSA